MKYNPKINEAAARMPGFARIHPLQPEETVQGALRLMYDLSAMLAEITGMDAVTLQPAAGAHGEQTGLMMIKAWHESRGDTKRTKVIVPDSAHGTNPASATVTGFNAVEVASDTDGMVDLESLKSLMDDSVAAHMLTNLIPWGSSRSISWSSQRPSTGRADWSTTTAPTPTPSWARPAPATWASTSST